MEARAPILRSHPHRAWETSLTKEELGRREMLESSAEGGPTRSGGGRASLGGQQGMLPSNLKRSLSFSASLHRSEDLGKVFARARTLRYVQREVDPRLL
eukprot:CAMPEP_0196728018 /NCGR_PEP_ID=MMETSP1091-20130531/8849_1 /TAXON_ID=302021 /ORGANISM="Rhodomonas sp., Strain CCMP768" /LENGTH=98 /DNA_ID=CAMNT_0042070717 /DNA_START=165 /DNA_END=461 /DNA_ORIENTATION=+